MSPKHRKYKTRKKKFAKIKDTSFGMIKIGRKIYKTDVIVTWKGKVKEAHTEKRHLISNPEFFMMLFERTDTMVIGTGQNGEMEISKRIQNFARKRKIKIFIAKTPQAIKIFNRLSSAGKNVVAYMHVTC